MALKGYTTEEAIENYLLVDIDDSFSDQVDEYIEMVEELIDDETNRDFTPYVAETAASDRTFDGCGEKTLPIDACTEIEEVRFSEEGDPLAATQYITTPVRKDTITGVKLKYLVFPQGDQNIYIKAKWGYSEVPKSIKFAATVLASMLIQNSWQSESEVQSVSVGRISITYKDKKQLNDIEEVKKILQFNKRFTF